MKTQKNQPILSPILRWFMLAMVLANIAGFMYPFLLSLYLVELGATIQQVGLVYTIASVFSLLLQVCGGWVSDSIGRLRAIAIGSAGGVLSFFGLFLAPTWQWMIVAIAASYFPRALVGPSFDAFIAENSREENRGRVYGVSSTIFRVTGVLGPPLGGLIAGQYGFKAAMLGASLLYAVAAVLRIWMATTMKSQAVTNTQPLTLTTFKTSLKSMWGMLVGGGVLTWIFLTDGVRDITERLSGDLQPLYLDQFGGIGVEQIGLLASILSIAMMLTPMLSGKLVDRYEERLPIALGFGLVFISRLVFLSVYSFTGFALSWVVTGLGWGLLMPAYSSLISKVVPRRMLGTFNGLFWSSIGLISLPAPYIGAFLWENFNPRLPFYINAVAVALAIIPVWIYFRAPSKTRQPDLGSLETESAVLA
jgi:DHA1 family multidrug resistance protein-like MFS transporter